MFPGDGRGSYDDSDDDYDDYDGHYDTKDDDDDHLYSKSIA